MMFAILFNNTLMGNMGFCNGIEEQIQLEFQAHKRTSLFNDV